MCCQVIVAWEDKNESPITSVPPHNKQLVDIKKIKQNTANLLAYITEMVLSQLKDYLETKGIGGLELTDARVKDMIDTTAKTFAATLDKKLHTLSTSIDISMAYKNRQLKICEIKGKGSNELKYFKPILCITVMVNS